MTQTQTNMADILKVAVAASQQSDRVLFIATLLILLAAAAWAFRALMRDRAEILRDAKEDRQKYQATLTAMIEEQNKLNAEYKVAIDRNTEALRVNNLLLEKQNHRKDQT